MKLSNKLLSLTIPLSSFLIKETDAIYLPGMVRLFKGDGNLDDSTLSAEDLTFNGGGGLTYKDETPYGEDSRKVFYFDGTRKAIGSSVGLPSGSASRTIMGWIKRDGGNGYVSFFGYGNSDTDQAYQMDFIHQDNMIHLSQWGRLMGTGAYGPTTDSTWYHIAATYDGKDHKLFVDGQNIIGSGIHPVPQTNADPATGGIVYVGGNASKDDTVAVFKGYIADFAIFDRALTGTEVKNVYNSKIGLETKVPTLSKHDMWSIRLVDDSAVVDFSDKINGAPPADGETAKEGEIAFSLKIADQCVKDLGRISTMDFDTCKHPINQSIIHAQADLNNKSLVDSDIYAKIPILVDIKTEKFEDSIDEYPGYFFADETGEKVTLKFCVKSELGKENIIKLDANGEEGETEASSISYTMLKFDITINMVTGFATNMDIQEKSASSTTETVDIAYNLEAYECDANDVQIPTPTVKTQNSMVKICINTSAENDVVIKSIKDLKLKSNKIASNAISTTGANQLTEVSGEGSKKVTVTTQMVSAFFSDLGTDVTDTIDIVGTAVMEFKAAGTRKLVRISSTNQKNGNVSDMGRKLDGTEDVGDAGLGEFEMKVGISGSSSDANGAATSGASNVLSVTPLVTITSLVLGGVLMGTMF